MKTLTPTNLIAVEVPKDATEIQKENKMESITLKEIAGYLPYSLKGQFKLSQVAGVELEKDEIREKLMTADSCQFFLIYCKPYLYNLSMLTKDEYFEMYLDLCDCLEMVRCDSLIEALQNNSYYALDIQKYKLLEEWMYKNHFDWKYNLIGRGLAIDKSKI